MSEGVDAAAWALECWALSTQKFDAKASTVGVQVPFPASVYTGLSAGGVAPSRYVRELIGDLGALAEQWEAWEAEQEPHPEG